MDDFVNANINVDAIIDQVLAEMANMSADSDEMTAAARNLKILGEVSHEEKKILNDMTFDFERDVIEHAKLDIEKEKIELDKRRIEADMLIEKERRKDRVINTVTTLFSTLGAMGAYILCDMLHRRDERDDIHMLSASGKANRNNIRIR